MGAAIGVRFATRLSCPIDLQSISDDLKPPQSFRYLDPSMASVVGVPKLAA
jgi:hypothetical protein